MQFSNILNKITITEHGKQVTKASCKYYKKILLGSGNGTSHLKRHAIKYFAKHSNNVGTSQSQINFGEGGGWIISLIPMLADDDE